MEIHGVIGHCEVSQLIRKKKQLQTLSTEIVIKNQWDKEKYFEDKKDKNKEKWKSQDQNKKEDMII